MVQNLGHLKHVHFVLFENSSHSVVAADLSLITGILKLICTNIFPEFFDRLWARELTGQRIPTTKTDVLTVVSPPNKADKAGESNIGF